jgi:DNA invertase Pin-like site-specific DNA recombinase
MKAVLYAAKSTEDTNGSIPTQLDDGRKLAAARGFDVVGEHKDEAASAYTGDRGPGLAKALAECERLSAEHGSCALIVQHSDRLARGDAKQARHLIEIVLWAIKRDVQLLSVQDPEMLAGGDMALLLGVIGGMRNHQDSKRKSLSVKDGMRRRAERGEWVGGHPPYGYTSSGQGMVVVPAQAAVVRRVFTDYASGQGQRAIVRALNDDGIPTATGKRWQQSRITRMLSNPAYIGKLLAKDDEGKRTRVLDGAHPAIVDDELWARVQTVRAGGSRRKGGRHADGAHLLVRGILRCSCGNAMLPRKARPGVERERYVCRGRIEHGSDFCSQPSIRREAIDVPLLTTLLDDGYFEGLDEAIRRMQEGYSSRSAAAREAQAEAVRQLASVDRRRARIIRGWQDEVIGDDEYARQRAEVDPEHEGATAAVQQREAHVRQLEQGGRPDAEQALLDHLARLKRAVGEGVGAAPDLHALRNTIGDLFESVTLVSSGAWPHDPGAGVIPWHDDVPIVTEPGHGQNSKEGAGRYWLLLSLRSSVVDPETLRPIGQAIPVPDVQSYPDTFLARYCWW